MTKKALILIDLQNDFITGTLAVANSDKIFPIIQKLLLLPFDFIIATKDWHPKDHLSFANNHNKSPGEIISLGNTKQILWPSHCVQGTHGAEFSPHLDKSKISKIFYKGTNKFIDSYSTFFDNEHHHSTGLAEYLNENKIKEIYLAGLTTDYCVKYSVLDAVKLGFKTFIIIDACQGVNLKKKR